MVCKNQIHTQQLFFSPSGHYIINVHYFAALLPHNTTDDNATTVVPSAVTFSVTSVTAAVDAVMVVPKYTPKQRGP